LHQQKIADDSKDGLTNGGREGTFSIVVRGNTGMSFPRIFLSSLWTSKKEKNNTKLVARCDFQRYKKASKCDVCSKPCLLTELPRPFSWIKACLLL